MKTQENLRIKKPRHYTLQLQSINCAFSGHTVHNSPSPSRVKSICSSTGLELMFSQLLLKM